MRLEVVLTTGVCVLDLPAPPVVAQNRTGAPPHVRAESATIGAMIAEAAERSVTFRTLVDRLERSNVIVYVRPAILQSTQLDGRVGWVSPVVTVPPQPSLRRSGQVGRVDPPI